MVRVMSYNICQGGDGQKYALSKIIQDSRVDMVGLLETIGWGNKNSKALKEFSNITQLPFSYFAKAKTDRVAPTGDDISNEWRWVTREELETMDLLPNIKYYAQKALAAVA